MSNQHNKLIQLPFSYYLDKIAYMKLLVYLNKLLKEKIHLEYLRKEKVKW